MPEERKSRNSRKAKQRKNLTEESEPCIQILTSKFEEMSIKTETADINTDSKFQISEISLKEDIQTGGMIFSFDENNFRIFPEEISKTSLEVLSALPNNASAEVLTVKQESFDDFPEEMTRDLANVACTSDINIKQEKSDGISEEITRIRFKTEPKFKENLRSSETSRDLWNVAYTGDINKKQETSDNFPKKMTRETINTDPKFNDENKNSKTIEASSEDVNVKQEPLDDISEEMTTDLANIACTRNNNIKQETAGGILEEITQLKFKTEPKYKENVRNSETSRVVANVYYSGDINIKQETSDDFSEKMTRKTIKIEPKFNDGDKNSKTIDKLINEIKVTDMVADSRNSRDPIMHSRSSSSQYTNNTEIAPSNSESHTQEYSGDNDRNCAFEIKAIFTKVKSNNQSLNCNSSLFLKDNTRIKKEAENDYGDNRVSKEIDVYETSENRKEEFERNCDKSRKRIKIEPNFIEDGTIRNTPCIKMEIQSEDYRGRLKDIDSAMPKERKPGMSRKAEQSAGDMRSNSCSSAPSSSRNGSQPPKIKRWENVTGKSETYIQNFGNDSDIGTSFVHDIRTNLKKSIAENAEEHIVGCLQGIRCDPAIEESIIPEYDTIIKLDNELFASTTLSEMIDLCAGRLRIPNAFDEMSIKTETADNKADSKFQNSECSLREGIQNGGMIFSFDENNFKIFPHEISASAYAVLRASANKPSTEDVNVKQESLHDFSEEMKRDLANVPRTGDINIKQDISDGISEEITRIRFKTEPKFKDNVRSSETSRNLSNVAYTCDSNKKQETSDNFPEKMTRETINTDPKFNDGNKNSKKIEASTEDVNVKQEPLDDFSEEITRDLANIACTRNINIKQETSGDFSEEITRKTIKTEPKFNDEDKNSKTIDKLTNEFQVSDIFADSTNSRDPRMHSRKTSSQFTNNTDRASSDSRSHIQEYSGDNDRNCLFENKSNFAKVESDKESLNYNTSLFLNDNIRIKKEAGNDYGGNRVSKEIDVYGTSINREEWCERNCDNTRKRIKIEPNLIYDGEDGNNHDTPCIKMEIQSEDCRGRAKKSSLKGCTFYLNTADTPEFHTDTNFSSVNEVPVLSALKKEKDPLKNKNSSQSFLSKRIQIKREVGNDTYGDTTPKETEICNISLKRKTHDEEIQQVILKKIKSEPVPIVFRKEKDRVEPKRIKSEHISIVSPNQKEEITPQKIKSERNSAVPEKDRNFQVLTLSDDERKFISLSENENEFMTLLEESEKIEESSGTEMEINPISAVAPSSSGVSDSLSKYEDVKRTAERKVLSSKILTDVSVQKKSGNCEDDYLIEMKREKTGPTIICLNVKDENDSKMTKNLKLNSIPIYHSEITCSSSSTTDWYCFEETSEKKVFSSHILKYFSVASELDRADIQKTLDYLEKPETKNDFENIFNILKKPKLKTSFEERDILLQNSPNSGNEKNDNIFCDSIKQCDVKCEIEPVIQFKIDPDVQSAITSRDSSSSLVSPSYYEFSSV